MKRIIKSKIEYFSIENPIKVIKAWNKHKAALLMPRKKKKRAKKSALLLYSIACWAEVNYNF